MKDPYAQFKAPVRREGQKGNKRLTLPAKHAADLCAVGIKFPCWIRISIQGFPSVFVEARFPPSRPSVTFTLPDWAFSKLQFGDEVTVTVQDAEPFRAPPSGRYEWRAYVDPAVYFPTHEGDNLLLHSRHEKPFSLHRDINESAWRVLGFFQAEGSKGKKTTDWNVGNTNPLLLEFLSDRLVDMGFGKERQYMEVRHGPNHATQAEARAYYERVGVRISTTRKQSGPGGSNAIVHVTNSKPLLRLMVNILDELHTATLGFPSKEAAKQYALGWLDGDGSIAPVAHTGGIELRMAGHATEHKIVIKALGKAFDWPTKRLRLHTPRTHSVYTLRLDQAAELARVGAFPFSLNRPRLLRALYSRLQKRANREDTRGRTLTKETHYNRAQKIYEAALQKEIEQLKHHPLWPRRFVTGIKGQTYDAK